jgi:hypothetical protein
MDIFTLKNVKVTPAAPAIGDSVTITGEVYLFGIPFIFPLWIIAAAQYPKSLWQKIMPILNGATEVRETAFVVGGKFSVTFPTGFTDGGDFPLFVDAYGGPEAVVSNITLPPFPSVAHYEGAFHVAINDEVPVGFEFGTPSASPGSVLFGDPVQITVPVKSTSARDQPDMSVVLEVRETALVGQGSLIGSTITSDKATLAPGATSSFKFTWTAAGAIGKKTIGATLLKAGNKAPNTKPDNPYGGGAFQNLFEVVAKKPGTQLTYGALTVETATEPPTQPSNLLLGEPDGTKITVRCGITNASGFALDKITASFQIKEESAVGTGTILATIPADTATSIPDKGTLNFTFPWTVSGGVCRKVGILSIKQNGNVIDTHDYGYIVEKITPRYLTLKVSPSSLTGVAITASPAKKVYKDGETVTISLPVAQSGTFSHWGGDTGKGSSGTDDWFDYRGFSVVMDKDRTITAYFTSQPPAVGYKVSAVNPPSGATTWFLQHTNDAGSNDFNSGWVGISTAVNVTNNTRGFFQGAFKDAGGNIIGNKATDFYTPDVGAAYYWDYSTNALSKTAPPVSGKVSFTVRLQTPPEGAEWRAEHFDANGNMDFHSEYQSIDQSDIQVTSVSPQGNVGIASRTNGIDFSTWYSTQFTATDGMVYTCSLGFTRYVLNIYVNIGGSVNVTTVPYKVSYPPGDVVTVTATPTSGYEFVNWSGDASGSSPSIQVTMNKDMNITANMRASGGGGGGTVSFSLALISFPALTYDWRLEHFDGDGQGDGFSDYTNTLDTRTLSGVAAYGNIGVNFRDADGNNLGTDYSPKFTAQDGRTYYRDHNGDRWVGI